MIFFLIHRDYPGSVLSMETNNTKLEIIMDILAGMHIGDSIRSHGRAIRRLSDRTWGVTAKSSDRTVSVSTGSLTRWLAAL